MKKVTLKSFAKINLTLEILDKLPSGFHKIDTVMTKTENLYDVLEFFFTKKHKNIIIKSTNPSIPTDKNNLCYKAAKVFFETYNQSVGIEIKIIKNIPCGSGLGGGSSNAASTLCALNEYFNKPFSMKELREMSYPIGKDISFFLSRKNTAFMTNLGEKMKKELSAQKFHILIINPKIHISTKEAYEDIPKNIWFMKNKSRISKSNKIIKFIQDRNTNAIVANLFNDFELKIEKNYPIIKDVKQSLEAFGALGSLMTGSGSTVFGIFSSKKQLEKTKKIMKRHYPDFIVK